MNKRLLKLEKHLIQTSPRRKRNHKQRPNILEVHSGTNYTQVTNPAFIKRFEDRNDDPRTYSLRLVYKPHGRAVETSVNKNPYLLWEYATAFFNLDANQCFYIQGERHYIYTGSWSHYKVKEFYLRLSTVLWYAWSDFLQARLSAIDYETIRDTSNRDDLPKKQLRRVLINHPDLKKAYAGN